MEVWRKVWRAGIGPQMDNKALMSLRDALERDDPRLLQGATSSPPPIFCMMGWPCEASDPIGWCGWMLQEKTVGEVEEFFARTCYECDQLIGEAAACQWFLVFWDDTPRDRARRELSEEIEMLLKERSQNG